MDQRLPFERFQTHLMLDEYYGDPEHVEYLIACHSETIDRSLTVPAQYKGNCCAVLFLYWLEMGLQTYEPGSDEVTRWHRWGKDLDFDPELQEIDRDVLRIFLEKHGLPLPKFWLYDDAKLIEGATEVDVEEQADKLRRAKALLPTLDVKGRRHVEAWIYREENGCTVDDLATHLCKAKRTAEGYLTEAKKLIEPSR